MMRLNLFWISLFLASMFVACGPAAAEVEAPDAFPTPLDVAVTVQQQPPTSTPEPSATAENTAIPPTVTPAVEPTATLTLGTFQLNLLETLTSKRDYTAIQAFMGDSFSIGYWRSEGVSLTPIAAAEELRTNLLPPGAIITYRLDRGFREFLGPDATEDSLLGPDVNVGSVIYSQGWGFDGKAEALLILARDADGASYWAGLIYAPAGF